MTHPLFVLGAGPHGRTLADVALDLGLEAHLLDDNPDVTCDGSLDRLMLTRSPWVYGPAWPRIRRMVDERVRKMGLPERAAILVHPDATVSKTADLNLGVVIMPGARVSTGATIGRHSHLHCNSVVAHSSWVGEHAMVCPGAMISGEVHVGDEVFLGVGACVRNGIVIGDGALIGAGAVVVRDVDPGQIVKGNPARVL